MKLNSKQIFFAVNILWAIIIFILCSLPGEDIPNPNLNIPHVDKVVHFGMFFIMSLLLIYLLENQTCFSKKKSYVIAILVAFIYGGTIEILQHYFFNRSGDLWDLLADVAGGMAGCLCYPIARRLMTNKKGN